MPSPMRSPLLPFSASRRALITPASPRGVVVGRGERFGFASVTSTLGRALPALPAAAAFFPSAPLPPLPLFAPLPLGPALTETPFATFLEPLSSSRSAVGAAASASPTVALVCGSPSSLGDVGGSLSGSGRSVGSLSGSGRSVGSTTWVAADSSSSSSSTLTGFRLLNVGSGGSRSSSAAAGSVWSMDGMLLSEIASGGSRSSDRMADRVSVAAVLSVSSSAASSGAPSLKQKSTESS